MNALFSLTEGEKYLTIQFLMSITMDTLLPTQVLNRVRGGGGSSSLREAEEGAVGNSHLTQGGVRIEMESMPRSMNNNNHEPKKRAILFSAFLACLSFAIILCNSFMSFVSDLLRDDAFLRLVDTYFATHNATKSYVKLK